MQFLNYPQLSLDAHMSLRSRESRINLRKIGAFETRQRDELFCLFSIGTKEIGGMPIRNEYCPIAGLYHFKYSINNDSGMSLECNTFSSDFNNCPDGSILHLSFKRCNSEAHGESSLLYVLFCSRNIPAIITTHA